MPRLYAVSLLTSLAILSGCADATAPVKMDSQEQARASSTVLAPAGQPVSNTSNEDDPTQRDGGNVMGGGGR